VGSLFSQLVDVFRPTYLSCSLVSVVRLQKIGSLRVLWIIYRDCSEFKPTRNLLAVHTSRS